MRSVGMPLAIATLSCFRIQAFHTPGVSSLVRVRQTQGPTSLSMVSKNDQLPAQAKRYYIRPDRLVDIVLSAPQLLLRLGSGALVDGYNCEWDVFAGFLFLISFLKY